jgi:hypothetical protein
MSVVAGVKNADRGLVLASATLTPVKGLAEPTEAARDRVCWRLLSRYNVRAGSLVGWTS